MKIKKIFKKSINIMVLLMLIFYAFIFSGCAQVRVMTITNEDNSIDELVNIAINHEEVIMAGYDVDELKLDIQTNAIKQAQEMSAELNNKITLDLLRVDEETKKILLGFKDGISVIKSDWKDNNFSVGIRFKNIDIYKYYYNIKDNIKNETFIEEHFFYNKIYYYASTMYVKHHNLYLKVKNYYSSKYSTLIESAENQLLYSYKTDLRRQHSDADFITKQDGYYYHTWLVDANKLDEPIMLYYNVANPENWIIVSICFTVGVAAILSIISVIVVVNKKTN